jgi:integrase
VRKAITTSKEIAALRLDEGRNVQRVRVHTPMGHGLFIEVRKGRNQKVWLYRFSIANKSADYRMGEYPAISLKKARELHADAVQLVKKGIDPRTYRAAEVAKNTQAWTMREAYQRWMKHFASSPTRTGRLPTERTIKQRERRWALHLEKELAAMRVQDVTRAKLIEVLSDAATKAREEARQCLIMLKGIFAYAEDLEQIEESPAASITPAKIKARPSPPKDRHLSLEELKELLQVLNDPHGRTSLTVRNVMRMLISTGARRSEVSQMQWSEVDLELGVWTLPADRTKTRQQRRVSLSSFSLGILKQQQQLSRSVFVFESPDVPGQAIGLDAPTQSLNRLQGRKNKERNVSAPLGKMNLFSIHDLRRTATTAWTEHLGADKLLADVMIGHAEPKLIATYNRADRWPLQVRIWERWGELLASLSAEKESLPEQPGSNNVVYIQFGKS